MHIFIWLVGITVLVGGTYLVVTWGENKRLIHQLTYRGERRLPRGESAELRRVVVEDEDREAS